MTNFINYWTTQKKLCKMQDKPIKCYFNMYSLLYSLTKKVTAICLTSNNQLKKCFKKINKKDTGVFAAGLLFGTAGIKLLSSKDAKKLYTNCAAAVLRAKECVLKTATTIQENAEDIYAEAQQINEERAAKDAEEYTDVEDAEEAEETAEEVSEENEAE